MARSACKACLVVLLIAGAIAGAHAQSALTPSQIDTARQRVQVPTPTLPDANLRLMAPEKSPVSRAIDELEFRINAVRITGVSAYPVAEFEGLFEPLLSKPVKLSDVHDVAERIEARYRADDYFLTRVFIPPQRVKDGVIEVRVVEGHIGAIFVEGGAEANRRRVEALLAGLAAQKPIRLSALESAVLTANELPGISASALLRSGAALGESELVLSLNDLRNGANVGTNNAGSDTTGKWGLSFSANINTPFGLDGQLGLGLNTSNQYKQTQSAFVRYARAFLRAGTTLSLGAVVSRSRPGGVLTALEVKSDSVSAGPRLRHALLRSRENSLYLDLSLSVNRATTSYLGVVQSADRSSVAEMTLSWQTVDPWGNSQASLSLFRGTGLAGAIGAGAGNASVANFTPRFKKWVYNFTRVQKLPARASVVFAMQTQDSADILLSGELAAFGGSYIGRGYDSSTISGDRGAGAILELRHDSSFVLGGVSCSLQPYAFVDTAITSSNTTRTRSRLRSSGLGLRMGVGSDLAFDLMASKAEIPIATGGESQRVVMSASARF